MYIIIIRVIRLREAINLFYAEYTSIALLTLLRTKWKQIKYLINIIRLFNFFTIIVEKTKSVTLPYTL
jgi:hypothetical protein